MPRVSLFKAKKLSRKQQSAARLENFRKDVTTDCHIIPLGIWNEITDPVTGLSPEHAKDVLKKTGPNALTPARKKSELVKFIVTLFHGFSGLLWLGALLCCLSVLISYFVNEDHKIDMENVVLAAVLILVVLVTGSFTYYQERKSQSIMESFSNMVPAKATVIRGGTVLIIDSKDVVIGDLVDIKFGDRVPADIRIIQCQGLKVDHSPLTGESEALPRATTDTDENFLETKNVALFSTNVVEGIGRGIVLSCGDQTVMGHIAGLTARLKPNKTPMAKELERFMRIVSTWAITLGIILGATCLLLGHTIVETILFAIGIIVANVPEGLLATVIVCLTVTAKRMASENCLIKKLDSVETLGSTSVICSDKTGTLTQNRMTVCHVWYNGTLVPVEPSQIETIRKSHDEDFKTLIRCATLCNRAEFMAGEEHKPVMQRTVRGDASEAAILKFVENIHLFRDDFRQKNPKMIEIPFSSSTKFQTSIHALEEGRCLLVMKGAPEVVLERCNTILQKNQTNPMTKQTIDTCNAACLRFAEMGERVLGFCDVLLEESYKHDFTFTTEPVNFPQRGLRFLGLLALIDPPRPQVPDAIRKCKAAGIKVAMVTGDHPVTAKAIAIKVGIITAAKVLEFTDVEHLRKLTRGYNIPKRVSSMMSSVEESPSAIVIHGSLLKHLMEDELDAILFYHPEIVFARTSPTQKLQIVEGYQRLGEIVTGDGVNDAPALKKADTGIAMGIAGTEVAQQAADVLLLDDNFASIITAVEEGRRIFDNLKKSITYTLASNVPQIFPFLGYSFVGIPLPLGIIAILCIDLLTDMMPAISLAYEKAESDIMQRPPRNPQRDRLVNRKLYFLAYGHLGMLQAFGLFFVYFAVMVEHGFMPYELTGLRVLWESHDKNVTDHYNRTWTYSQRMALQGTCFTACMMSVVVTQWMNLIACKTRINSIVKQGMGNMVLNASLVVETIFTCALAYIPYMYYLNFFPISWRWWLYAVPFAVVLLVFDEMRKWHIRTYPKGWYQRETFY